ncbi:MAG: efflux RND transporter periplasmic adaptor subunit [Candidatus Cloacimonetes bacterium]|nr:efflux RND transporter periplasmic adaptor subunit [Candidatus Cloacimonadota bacterium]
MNKKKVITPIIILLAGIVIVVGLSAFKKKPKQVKKRVNLPLVEVKSFVSETKSISVKGNGTVLPNRSVSIVPQISGKIIEVSASMTNGGKFKKGDLLFKIDPKDYELRLKSAKALVLQQEMMFLTEKRNYEVAQMEWEEYARTNPDANPNELTLRKPQLNIAEANFESAKANLGLAELNLERTEIKAPFDGIVMKQLSDVGQYVAPGATIAQIYGINKAIITVPVKNSELKWLNSNFKGEAKITAEFAGEQNTWFGKLVRKEASLDLGSRMSNLVVEIKNPQNLENPLPFGLFVEVEISGKEFENVITIPRHLIKNQNEILTIEDNKISFKKVNIIKFSDEDVLINSGLDDTNQIIISRLDIATPGMKVRVKENNE